MAVQKGAPPAKQGKATVYDELVQTAKASAGDWFSVPTKQKSETALQAAKTAVVRDTAEVAVRDGRVYIRYLK